MKKTVNQVSFVKAPFTDQRSQSPKLNESSESKKHRPILSINSKYLKETSLNNQKFSNMAQNNHILKTMPIKHKKDASNLQTTNFKITNYSQFQTDINPKIKVIQENLQELPSKKVTPFETIEDKRFSIIQNNNKRLTQTYSESTLKIPRESQTQNIQNIQPMNYLDVPTLNGKSQRPKTAIKKVQSQPRFSTAITQDPNTPEISGRLHQLGVVEQNHKPTQSHVTFKIHLQPNIINTELQKIRPVTAINSNRGLKQKKKNHAFSATRLTQQSQGFDTISHFEEPNYYNDLNSITENNNYASTQSVIVELQDIPQTQRVKLQHLARKSVNKFMINRKAEDCEKIHTFTGQEILKIFDAKNLDLGLPFKQQQFDKFKEHCETLCINRRINLQDMGLGLNFAKILDEFLISTHIDLSHIILSRNRLKDEGVKLLSKHIVQNKSLISLDLSQNEITHIGAAYLSEALQKNESIISLDLGSYDGLYRNRLGVKGIRQIKLILESEQNLISHILLAGNYIKNKGVQILSEGLLKNNRVIELDLTNNELQGIAGCEPLFEILTSEGNCIRKLTLSKNQLGNAGIEKIAKALRNVRCIVQFLNLKECDFNKDGAKPLFESIKMCFTLRTLILDKNKLTGLAPAVIFQMLLGNSSIQTLSLAKCNLKDEGSQAIFEGLEKNTALKNLNLSHNQLGDKAVLVLAKRINQRCFLKNIDLGFNHISNESGVPLMQALNKNETFLYITLNNNQLDDETAKELIETLKTNKVLRKINLTNNAINVRYIEGINNCLYKNDTLAIERVIPDFKKEKQSMANDRKEYDFTCKELLNCCINKAATMNRVKLKEKELEDQKQRAWHVIKELEGVSNSIVDRMKMFERMGNDMDQRLSDKERYVEIKERELKTLINNTIKDQFVVENETQYYANECKNRRIKYQNKINELLYQLQEQNRRFELERRSYFIMQEQYDQIMKLQDQTNANEENKQDQGPKSPKQSSKQIDFATDKSQNINAIDNVAFDITKKKKKQVIKKKNIK